MCNLIPSKIYFGETGSGARMGFSVAVEHGGKHSVTPLSWIEPRCVVAPAKPATTPRTGPQRAQETDIQGTFLVVDFSNKNNRRTFLDIDRIWGSPSVNPFVSQTSDRY